MNYLRNSFFDDTSRVRSMCGGTPDNGVTKLAMKKYIASSEAVTIPILISGTGRIAPQVHRL
jgi:hypothetical protein